VAVDPAECPRRIRGVKRAARLLAAALLGLAALTVSGCGGGEQEPAAAASNRVPTIGTTLYFLTPDGAAPIGVRREIPRTSPYALQALRALLAGPTEAERKQGITSAIPEAAELLTFRTEGKTTGVVDLAGLPEEANAVERVRVIIQITRSLVGLSGIERVRVRSDGEPWGLWLMSGGVADEAYGYEKLLGLSRVCVGKSGTEIVEGDCVSALP